MKVQVNHDVGDLHRQQIQQLQAQRDAAPGSGAPPARPAKVPPAQQSATIADLSARVASENLTASRSEPIDALAAQRLRQQIQDQPSAAVNAHNLESERIRQLLNS